MEDHVPAAEPEPVLERPARDFVLRHAWPDSRDRMAALWNGDGGDEPDVEEEWLALPGHGGRRIRVRILRPAGSAEDLPVVLYLHGLGWMLTDAYAHRRLLADLVLGTDAAVIVPEYDQPADARHPGAVERAYTVSRWIARHGGEWRLDGSRMAVVGVSAGAHQAAALTLVTRERGGPDLRHQVLVCPVTDAAMDTASYHRFANGYFLSRTAMRGYWQQYAPDPETRAHATVSPLRADVDRLRGLPSALVLTAEADVLRDEGEAYAARLRAADVPVVSVRYHGTIHAFVLFDLLRDTGASRAARIQVTDTLHAALHAA
ncbi:exported lipase/esterase [Streptomyces davaonensis JCM 4913]|uniref:Exported lipase/esterase n=1 Tax=Streptomyces davaonensis (strain DSM 101723 / JCM 4913 / KCC S-0913 / 768) TaxID=1214101 RepID=K4QWH3_STRDJ|nr:alpha/beta hydrolase [Streptomyces davaonensis]CCK25195.1 exported lipase/esterase [Streptomyces davaonensis JCM 4913]